MFGALTGHLDKARNVLQRSEKLFETQASVEKTVRTKNRESGYKLKQMERAMSATSKENTLSRRDTILTQIRQTELSILTAAWEKRYRLLGNFITTKADPPIMWLPKEHTDATRAALEESKQQIEASIQARHAQDALEFRAIEEQIAERAMRRRARLQPKGNRRIGLETQSKEDGNKSETEGQDENVNAENGSPVAISADKKETNPAEDQSISEEVDLGDNGCDAEDEAEDADEIVAQLDGARDDDEKRDVMDDDEKRDVMEEGNTDQSVSETNDLSETADPEPPSANDKAADE